MNTAMHSRLGAVAALIVVAIAAAAFFVGFYVLPSQGSGSTVWERICRAAGVVQARSDARAAFRPLPASSSRMQR